MDEQIHCAFDKVNDIMTEAGGIWHACEYHGTYRCINCDSRYGKVKHEEAKHKPIIIEYKENADDSVFIMSNK